MQIQRSGYNFFIYGDFLLIFGGKLDVMFVNNNWQFDTDTHRSFRIKLIWVLNFQKFARWLILLVNSWKL